MMKKIKLHNPVLRGVRPDPSVCRSGQYYYMVTSSFAQFPGIPLYRSTNLADWKLVSYVLERKSQMMIDGERMSHGIWAPTIRYHNGIYYVSATNVSYKGNFYVTAEKAEGKWSEPHWIKGADFGIDPELFFDDDGKVYMVSASPYAHPSYPSQSIIAAEVDLSKDCVINGPWIIWDGALKKAHSPEAPHIYKKDGWYYLISAEGGTESYHCVTVSRSRDIRKKFDGYAGNPILTHRHLGKNYPVTCVGHGDLICTPGNQWYMALLGMRNNEYHFQSIGRETFIVPVSWQEGWPVAGGAHGVVEPFYEIENPEDGCTNKKIQNGVYMSERKQDGRVWSFRDDFKAGILNKEWSAIGTGGDFYKLGSGGLSLFPRGTNTYPEDFFGCGFRHKTFELMSEKIPDGDSVFSFLGHAQKEYRFEAETKLYFTPGENGMAGLIFLQNNYHQMKLQLCKKESGIVLQLVKVEASDSGGKAFAKETVYKYTSKVIKEISYDGESIYLRLSAVYGDFCAAFSRDGKNYEVLDGHADGWFLGKRENTGFTGAKTGVFCCGDGKTNAAHFEWYAYKAWEII